MSEEEEEEGNAHWGRGGEIQTMRDDELIRYR